MGYKYQDHCFDTVGQLYQDIAAQCPPVSGNNAITCIPDVSSIQITATDLQTSTQFITVIQPPLINCDLLGEDFIEFNWLLAGILISAASTRFIVDFLRNK